MSSRGKVSTENMRRILSFTQACCSGEEKRPGIPQGKGLLVATSGSDTSSCTARTVLLSGAFWCLHAFLPCSALHLPCERDPPYRLTSRRHRFEGLWENGEMHGAGTCHLSETREVERIPADLRSNTQACAIHLLEEGILVSGPRAR